MALFEQTIYVSLAVNKSYDYCLEYRHEFAMPEHLLLALTDDLYFQMAVGYFGSAEKLNQRLREYLGSLESMPKDEDYTPQTSEQLSELMREAFLKKTISGAPELDVPHLVFGLLALEDSWAAYLLKDAVDGNEADFMSRLIELYGHGDDEDDDDDEGDDDDDNGLFDSQDEPVTQDEATHDNAAWRRLVTCMNDFHQLHNPLVGRQQELERTIQVLCRRDKNNPLHVGESGVGKTALVWGLARLVEQGQVPARLQGSRIYQLDMGTLLAGTQYRGDFENRIKQVMDGIQAEGRNNIVYIDEIHTLVGAGANGDSALDASNMLKPYLESGTIRFIGSTTYEEYNRYFSRSKSLIRRFQQIDIAEPTVDEAKHILRQLQPGYEQFHGVRYDDEAVDFAVEASARHITDRYLPDKAIDLIDEAGAAKESEKPKEPKGAVKRGRKARLRITKADIADVLSKTCRVDALAVADDDDYQKLETLSERMLAQIYGQDEAVRQVVEAIQMSRAGLLDDNKPLASLLFVGPTGVGKTEVARVLARELGVELQRFDMSEYTEKHAVAKLIGSPAGYVGYEDGGLLTDAIRKSPNCVLLLDEIEKAHQDIYNILLQVMDYARLTDNKGRKADFHNVVLIMTSNAGAQFAGQTVGFSSTVSRGDAMMRQVKRTFKPEFLNRLSGTVVFHDMDRHMAELILQKKLRELGTKLAARQVTMTLADDAFQHLLSQGFTAEYGAREMDRVIAQQLKPLLMREILFGRLKQGGAVTVTHQDGKLVMTVGAKKRAKR